MEHTTTVLEEYRKADNNKRLHLYLEFPYFRQEFFKIEMERDCVNRDS